MMRLCNQSSGRNYALFSGCFASEKLMRYLEQKMLLEKQLLMVMKKTVAESEV